MGKYRSVTALAVAYQMKNVDVCRYAVSRMEGLPEPQKMPFVIFETIGSGPAWSITRAAGNRQKYCFCNHGSACGEHKWSGDESDWMLLAKDLELPGM